MRTELNMAVSNAECHCSFPSRAPKVVGKIKGKDACQWQSQCLSSSHNQVSCYHHQHSLLKIYIYFSFGCISTQLRLTGSLLHSASFSSCGSRVPGHASLVVIVHRLRCPAACGILDPQLRIPPRSPALQGGFLTIGLPGKPQSPSILFSAKKNRSNGLCRELSK